MDRIPLSDEELDPLDVMDLDNEDLIDDYDDELDGLTIVECSGEAELFEFCTGYNII